MKKDIKHVVVGLLYTLGPLALLYGFSYLAAYFLIGYLVKPSIGANHITFINPEVDRVMMIWIGGKLIVRKIKMPLHYCKRKLLKDHH